MTDTIRFYYVGTTKPSTSSLTISDLVPTAITQNTSTLWYVDYSESKASSNANYINGLYNIFYTMDSHNKTMLDNLRVDYCTRNEDYPKSYCSSIDDFNKIESKNTCSRIFSTNATHNSSYYGTNFVNCPGLSTLLTPGSDNYSVLETDLQTKYKTFCDNNLYAKECQCYNRSQFDGYKSAYSVLSSNNSNTILNGNDICWYIPCQFKDRIVVPPNLIQSYDKVECPSVCQNILAVLDAKTVYVSDIDMVNNCGKDSTDSNGSNTDISKTIAPTTTVFTEKPTTPTNDITISKPMLIIIICSGIILFLILIIQFV